MVNSELLQDTTSIFNSNIAILKGENVSVGNRNKTVNQDREYVHKNSSILNLQTLLGGEDPSFANRNKTGNPDTNVCTFKENGYRGKGLFVMYTNADSILNKRKELMTMVDLHHYDIIVITEILPQNRDIWKYKFLS